MKERPSDSPSATSEKGPKEVSEELIAGVPAMRRTAGPRRELSERVLLSPTVPAKGADSSDGARALEGWALNVSRGGVRVILEEKVSVGDEFLVQVGADHAGQLARVVWVQEEPDGVIAGFEFRSASGMNPSAPALDAEPLETENDAGRQG